MAANINESKVEGVSYTYDSESRSPLGLKAKIRMWAGTLVYDEKSKPPTEILEDEVPEQSDNKIYFLQYLAESEDEVSDEAMLANLTEDMLNGTVPVTAVSLEDGETIYSYTAKPVATSAGKFTNTVNDAIEVTGDGNVYARCLYAWDPTVYNLTEALDKGLQAPVSYTLGTVGKYAVALFFYNFANGWGHILTFANA